MWKGEHSVIAGGRANWNNTKVIYEEDPQTMKTDLTQDPSVSLQGIFTKSISIYRATCTSVFIYALFTIDISRWEMGTA